MTPHTRLKLYLLYAVPCMLLLGWVGLNLDRLLVLIEVPR